MKLATQRRMKEYAAGIQSSELRLIDVPAEAQERSSDVERASDAEAPPPAGAGNGTATPHNGSADDAKVATAPYNLLVSTPASSDAKPSGEAVVASLDKFLTAAGKEFEAGIVDQPLWKHAVAQAAGDRTVATSNYLRARATALRVAKREKRQERLARRERAVNELAAPAGAGPAATPRNAPNHSTFLARRGLVAPGRAHVLWIGGGLAAAFLVALFIALRSEGDPAQRSESLAGSVSPASPSAASTPNPTASAPAAASGKRDEALREDWPAKLEQLKAAGNWNVVVLYAAEWARAQPDNASPWKDLTAGYVKLRQYRDALETAKKVVQLTPEDSTAWRSLGQVNAALRQPAEALAAYEQAVARNESDAASIVQVGMLATQLGRYPDARDAFAKALALNPADVDAMCGAASLAQKEQRAKDAETLLRQVAALDARCREVEGESVRVAVGDKTRPPASPR